MENARRKANISLVEKVISERRKLGIKIRKIKRGLGVKTFIGVRSLVEKRS